MGAAVGADSITPLRVMSEALAAVSRCEDAPGIRWPARATYSYAGTEYANPHALTGYFNGTATMTYAYDAIGNLATTTGATTSSFNWTIAIG